MKAEELMIGDWVRDNLTQDALQINASCILQFEREQERGCDISVSPIVITPEILKANGFVDRGKAGWQRMRDEKSRNRHLTLYLESGMLSDGVPFVDFYDTSIVKHIHHVHELQHGLKQCKLCELAKDFKVVDGQTEKNEEI